MVEVHLYGKLRTLASTKGERIIKLEVRSDDTVFSLLRRLNIHLDQVHHIFLNSKLLVTRNRMASQLGYPQVLGNPLEWKVDFPVRDGDRIGLFGHDMAALVV